MSDELEAERGRFYSNKRTKIHGPSLWEWTEGGKTKKKRENSIKEEQIRDNDRQNFYA